MSNSPLYLDRAGSVYVDIGLPEKAWPLYRQATALQPGVDLFQANLAACGVYLGKITEAKDIYQGLLKRFPNHRRNHYQLSRLDKATDSHHIDQMKQILRADRTTADKNIFMYYAIGKELEDLERWEESFEYYRKAGDTVTSVANYDVATDLKLIDKIIDVCDRQWLAKDAITTAPVETEPTPIFIVGLPRTGTTLSERIVSNHSQVQSIGETQFLQMVLRRESGIQTNENMNPAIIEAAARVDIEIIARGYLEQVHYRLGDEPIFIDKLPFNFLFLGFIAKAYPKAKIIHLGRHPMDACFAMYKQVFTWAYKFSYSLDGLGQYYVAHHRLLEHWRKVLDERLIEVEYESLVTEPESQVRILLDKLNLPFEQACMDFEKNVTPSATASSVQIRQKVHTRSVDKWQRFATQLEPLKRHLESAGIAV